MSDKHVNLFSAYTLGSVELRNRIVMAPMTRSRAIGNIPNELMAKYYGERATAGLIITEGTAPSPNGLGYARIPGIFSDAQVAGWRKVTEAVHANDGRIFVQLMHCGRVGHAANLPEGAALMAPSAIAATGDMWTDTEGMKPIGTPTAIPTDKIADVIAEYVHATKMAMEAGFDGVEIHAANGYLPMQFLSPGSNHRDDQYGGSHENRNRFVLELATAITTAIGSEKVGIRLSPFNKFNDITADAHEEEQYLALTEGLKHIGLAYIHLLTFAMPAEMIGTMKAAFGGTLILNGGYTADRADSDIAAGKGELVSFGNLFIGNPDLVRRMKIDAPMETADQNKFYTPGPEGYTDYPAL